MIAFQVDDMACGHCVSTITKAVKAVDQGASVKADLASHRVEIELTESDAQELRNAIQEAGYTPVPMAANAAPAATPNRSGSCCG
ncbi:heavy-metal-associated domain-containing protein [Piscinibacter koreensis]|uniref:Heavy-metal-associated domain-containing protein n=1 Tax=Piscinibacter koreensis TaxID=2742824 RepID=A0A7Y6NMU5_9BURK|nr:heavy-metal-associated domain-containing protein [Schlegelella koreensis]NUZ05977.1 heavy-metal-associated domain-containing protein [Schlegelella koreensis]